MMKNHLLLAVALAVITFFVNEVDAQLNANPTIPQHLLPCYRNPDIYMRENRFTSKLRRFIDLVKKIEKSRGGQQKTARDIAMALLYHLRLDGIQPTPNVQQTQDITPFAPGGNNYYKHRLTLVGLLPRANRPTNYAFLNESLNEYEMCNLHFMLSYSVDPYKRENEDCSNIKFEDAGSKYSQGYDSGYYGYRGDTYRSYPRYTRQVNGKWEKQIQNLENRFQHLKTRLENLRRKKRSTRSERSNVDKEEYVRNPDVEIIPVKELESISKSAGKAAGPQVKKGDFTLGHQEFIGPGTDHFLRGGYVASRTNEGNLNKRKAMYYGEETSKMLIPGQAYSACPIENGVVQDKYGSVTIGIVVAGIAAGFNFQKLSLSDFNAQLKGPLANEKINNIWATTLAGNAADLILSLGYINNIREGVGLRGGWNSLARPKWYMLEKGTPNYLTDVELRGALDGLWLGLTVEKYSRQLGPFSLSNILEMYYSDDGFLLDPKVKASKRGDEVTAYAPTEEFKKQLHLLSVVMENQRVNTVTYSDYTTAVADAVSAINSYIAQLSPRQHLSTASQARANIDQKIDLTVIFDPSWGLPNLEYYIELLIEEQLGATPGQANLTVICPFDNGLVVPIVDSADFEYQFDKIFTECRKGGAINYKLLFGYIQNHYAKAIAEENANQRINPYSYVSLIMMTDTQRPPDTETAREELQRLKEYIPGVEIIVATNGRKEKFRELVSEPEKDLFSLKVLTDFKVDEDVNQLINRIARVPRRLTNPAAGNLWGNATTFEIDSELDDDVRIGRTAIYRIDPYYIYDSKDVKINIRTKGHIITVCTARQQLQLPPHMQRSFHSSNQYPETGPYPSGNGEENGSDGSNGEGGCKKGTSVVFDFENLCEDADSMEECKPLYLSIQAPLQPKIELKCVNCRFPTNVEYNIKITGLTGTGVATVVISTTLLFLSVIISSLTSRLF